MFYLELIVCYYRDHERISSNVPDNESYKSTDSGHREQTNKVTHYSEEGKI